MYTKEQYDQAFKLRKEGLTYLEIAKKLNIIYPNTVRCWIIGKNKPQGHFLDSNHNKSSPELGYILGVTEGDGYIGLKKTKGHIGLEVRDKDFAQIFKKQLEKWSGLQASFGFNKNKKLYFTILHSLRAAEFLKNFKISNLINSSSEVKSNFLRGIFDSDGGVAGSNLKIPRIATRFIAVYNTNEELILLIKDLIESLGIKVQNIDKRLKSGFTNYTIEIRLRIGGRENLEKFKKKIGFSIERKNKKLEEVLNSFKKTKPI